MGPEPEAGALEDQGLGWKSKHGSGLRRRRHHRRPGSHLVTDAGQVEQSLLRQPVQVRMGADQEPGRCMAVAGERRRAFDSGPLRRVEEACADHADDRPVAALRPDLREDLAAVPRASRTVRGRLRPRLVQAHPSRHGSGRALPRPACAEGDADLAGPDSAARSSAGR